MAERVYSKRGSICSQRSLSSSQKMRATSQRRVSGLGHTEALLTDISPGEILSAFESSVDLVTYRDERDSFLQECIANATEHERAWGIKAAVAARDIRQWHEEIQGWRWEHASGEDVNPFTVQYSDNARQQYEARIEEVKDGIEHLGLADLKAHVRYTHVPNATTGLSAGGDFMLKDFTAVTTAMIVQTLPILSKLNVLMQSWTVRLIVLRIAPGLKSSLDSAKKSMQVAWTKIGHDEHSDRFNEVAFSRTLMSNVKAKLESQLCQLGKTIDSLLDLLEGLPDCLPDDWIEALDSLENEYTLWIVKAEELVLNSELESKARDADASQHAQYEPAVLLDGTADSIPGSILSGDLGFSGDQGKTATLQLSDLVKHQDPSSAEAVVGIDDTEYAEYGRRSAETGPVVVRDGQRSPSRVLRSGKEEFSTPQYAFQATKPSLLMLDKASTKRASSSSASVRPGSTTPDSAADDSDFSSGRSSPEIMSASSVAAYRVTPVRVSTSRLSNRISLQGQPFDYDAQSRLMTPLGYRPALGIRDRAMTMPPGDPIFAEIGHPLSTTNDGPGNRGGRGHTRNRSTSLQSFSDRPAGHVSMSFAKPGFDSMNSESRIRVDKEKPLPSPPITPEIMPVGDRVSRNLSYYDNSSSQRFHRKLSSHSSPQENIESMRTTPPQKSRSRFEILTDLATSPSKLRIRKQRRRDAAEDKEQNIPTTGPKDQLEARITSILSTIPADIHLQSTAERPCPLPSRSRTESISKTLSRRSLTPKVLRKKLDSNAPPSITLAPVPITMNQRSVSGSNTKPSSNTFDPDIKVYHLNSDQSSTAPIKLFVRLVGEHGERVMVRVGGGWADLGEYLCDYVLHHGSKRRVSATLDSSSPTGSSKIDLNTGIVHTSSPSTTPPSNGFGRHDLPTRPASAMFHRTPPSSTLQDLSIETATSTPSRPPSRASLFLRSFTPDSSPSLMGFKRAQTTSDLSPGDKAWVDDVMNQARSRQSSPALNETVLPSGRKTPLSRSSYGMRRSSGHETVGFLGNVGGSKRVFPHG